ncbi:MAG: hypothetical protein K2R98_09750 [Gemmataceae bacterium]|nr:hypothetical protein [Gemmataceae bacterium]
MVKVIPARIENGQVVPESPLPPTADVRSVSILVEIAEVKIEPVRGSFLARWAGVLNGYEGDARQEYREYLEKKYQ